MSEARGRIFIVALAAAGPSLTVGEKDLEVISTKTKKELVMLHPSDTDLPKGTRRWLKVRPWVSANFHVKMHPRMMKKKAERRIRDLYSRVMLSQPDIHSDFSRLARYITGGSIGLVLGGGGARGAAHLGMLQAIRETGIPVGSE